MDFERSLLCCEEEMEESPIRGGSVGTTPSSSSSSSASWSCASTEGASSDNARRPSCGIYFADGNEEEGGGGDVDMDEVSVASLQSRQAIFAPSSSYLTRLQSRPSLCASRSLAARWIVKAHFTFNFNPLTAALAVNYLDRYLEKSFTLPWKPWMMELLSVACLSLAAKMEEVDVPALLDLQACEGLEHAFEAKTVQRMEMNVLSALSWRMSSITAFPFAERAIRHLRLRPHLKNALLTRTSELLIATFQEAEFLKFEACVVGVSSLCCALEEILPVQAPQLKLSLSQYIPLDSDKAKSCYVQMEALIVDPVCTTTSLSGSTKSPLSPDTVAYQSEDSASVGTSPYFATNDLFLERLDFEEIVFYPKRQRTS